MSAYKNGVVNKADFVFNPASSTITFSSNYIGLAQSDIMYITNVKQGSAIVIYDFSSSTLGGTLNGLVLTLNYSTVAMASTDPLTIILAKADLPTLVYQNNAPLENGGNIESLARSMAKMEDAFDLLKAAFDRRESTPMYVSQLSPTGEVGRVNVDTSKNLLSISSGATPITADTDLILPVKTKKIKVLSYALFTDSTTQNVVVFKANGSSGTVLWTVPLQTIAAGSIFGANLTTALPGFLFATGVNQALSIDVSAAVNLWYSLTYHIDDSN